MVNLTQVASTDAAETSFDAGALVEQVECLQQEVQSLTQQVSRDFEELALLQVLAGSMELRAATPEPLALVLDVLPRLPMSIMCEGVALVPNAEAFADYGAGRGNAFTLWSGPPIVDDLICHTIVKKFGKSGASEPSVVNGLEPDEVDARVRDLIVLPIQHGNRIAGWLIAFNHVTPAGPVPHWFQEGFTTIEANLMMTSGSILATQLHNMRLLRQKEQLFTDVVRAMVNALEARDQYTYGHSERVALFGRELAREAGLPNVDCERIYLTGLLHDVGKIAVPDSVLQNPGKLSEEDRRVIETHPDVGWRILIPLSQLTHVLPGVLYHHERIDGKGYPDGLAGDDIPMDGRILAICDAYDAMTSDRPYRSGMNQEKAEEILRDGAGTQWDAKLMEHFFMIMPRIKKIRGSYSPRQPQSRKPGSCEQVNEQPF